MGAPGWTLLRCLLVVVSVLSVRLVGGVAFAAEQPQPPPAPQCAGAAVTLRLFLDLECPHCRRAWPVFVRAAADQPCTVVQLHHLPLSAHPNAFLAAQVAVVARKLGKELPFVDRVFATGRTDEATLAKVLAELGLDGASVLAQAKVAPTQQALQRERQAALAFGVNATPSALIDGRGLGGVPPEQALARALAVAKRRADRLAADVAAGADSERAGLCAENPEFVPAFDALRAARVGAPAAAQPQPGTTGALYRVPVLQSDTVMGGKDAAVTLVLFVDLARPWTFLELADVLKLASTNPGVRVAVKWLASAGPHQSEGERVAALLQAWATGPARDALLGAPLLNLAAKGELTAAKLQALQDQLAEPDRRAIAKAAASGDTAAQLQGHDDLSRRVDAGPGALFVQGRRWLGRAGDSGLGHVIAAAARAAAVQRAQGLPAETVYRDVIAPGRWRSDVDLDLGPREELVALPEVGQRGPTVHLLVDFASQASRAAWFMVRRLVQPGATAIKLQLGALPRNGTASPSGKAFAVAAALGKQLAAADALFAAAKPDDAVFLAKMPATCQLTAAQWSASAQSPQVVATTAAIAALRQRVDLGDEPVIAIDGRMYVGPLDEARLQRAIFAPQGGGGQP